MPPARSGTSRRTAPPSRSTASVQIGSRHPRRPGARPARTSPRRPGTSGRWESRAGLVRASTFAQTRASRLPHPGRSQRLLDQGSDPRGARLAGAAPSEHRAHGASPVVPWGRASCRSSSSRDCSSSCRGTASTEPARPPTPEPRRSLGPSHAPGWLAELDDATSGEPPQAATNVTTTMLPDRRTSRMVDPRSTLPARRVPSRRPTGVEAGEAVPQRTNP